MDVQAKKDPLGEHSLLRTFDAKQTSKQPGPSFKIYVTMEGPGTHRVGPRGSPIKCGDLGRPETQERDGQLTKPLGPMGKLGQHYLV